MFAQILALNVFYTGFADHAFFLAKNGGLQPNLMAAAYLLCSYVSPALWAVTATAAVTTYSDRHAMSFPGLLREALGGGLKAGPVATAVDSNILWVASRCAFALRSLVEPLIVRRFLTLPLIDLLVALHVAHHLFQLYLSTVFSVAVVVSAAEPACHGPAALRRAWRLTSENVTQGALFVAVEGALARWYECTACGGLVWLPYVLLSSAARLFAVCAATAYYHERRQSVDAAPAAAAGRRQLYTNGKEWLWEMLQGRSSIRDMLATMVAGIRGWSHRMLAIIVSSLPFVCCVLILLVMGENMQFMFFPNNLVLYRSSLRAHYHSSLPNKWLLLNPEVKSLQSLTHKGTCCTETLVRM